MQIVIDIPEEEYEVIVNSEDCGLHTLTRAIANGIPLPKGHGRLIDADKINDSDIKAVKRNGKIYVELSDLQNLIDNAPTVLEADKEGTR